MTITLSFAASYAALCGVQALTVAAPGPFRFRRLERLSSRWLAAAPLLSVVGTIVAIRAASATADGLAWLALVAVPPLAAFALARVVQGARLSWALLCVPLFLTAWAFRGSLLGDAAGVALTSLSCVTLGALLASTTPASWLKAGIVLMAIADTALVVSDLLQAPNELLSVAAPAGGLPQLQRAELGSAVMGYGDLFVAALLGALLAREYGRQRSGALLTGALALAFGTLFVFVHELPATVPVAIALLALEWRRARERPVVLTRLGERALGADA